VSVNCKITEVLSWICFSCFWHDMCEPSPF
jgi:alpha-glucosidase (family GH31 glycosyl hydrolase)